MVLWGITYEPPSYLPLTPFSARSPFSLCLCLAHTTTLSHRQSPSQFPSSLCALLPTLSPHVHPLSLFPSSHRVSLLMYPSIISYPLAVYCTLTCLLLPIYFTDLLTPFTLLHAQQHPYQRSSYAVHTQGAEPFETLQLRK